jgi:hypothetical protein
MTSYLGQKVRWLTQLYPQAFAFKTTWKANEILGVEFEVEGTNLPVQEDLTFYWQRVEDNSLRPGFAGDAAEFVLKRPTMVDYFEAKCFPYLMNKIREKGSTIAFSNRCSTHFHVSVIDLFVYQVFAYVGLYYVLEDLFQPIVGEVRDGNLFCLGTRHSDLVTNQLTDAAVAGNFQPLFFTENNRYSAVNVLAVKKYGTVEFRAMQGTFEQERIFLWIDMLMSMREYASKLQPGQMSDLLTMMSMKGPAAFVCEVLGGPLSKGWKYILSKYTPRQIDKYVYNGISRIQALFYEPDWKAVKKAEAPAKTDDRLVRVRPSGLAASAVQWQTVEWDVTQGVMAQPTVQVNNGPNAGLDDGF